MQQRDELYLIKNIKKRKQTNNDIKNDIILISFIFPANQKGKQFDSHSKTIIQKTFKKINLLIIYDILYYIMLYIYLYKKGGI